MLMKLKATGKKIILNIKSEGKSDHNKSERNYEGEHDNSEQKSEKFLAVPEPRGFA